MRAETQSWPMPMRTCACHLEENLFLRQCIILCASTAQMECMLAISQATLRRTAVSACRSNMRLRFSTWSASELQSLCLAGHRLAVIPNNRGPQCRDGLPDLQARASRHLLINASLRLRHSGGDDPRCDPRMSV